MDKPRFAALIGDLVESRQNQRRSRVQKELRSTLEELNAAMGHSILAADFRITAGDEFQALFRRPSHAVEAIQVIADRMFGAPLTQGIAFGIGWGTLSTGPIESQSDVALLDGPCFHLARTALESSRKAARWVTCKGFGTPTDEALSALFGLMGSVREGWTANQGYATSLMRKESSQKAFAQSLGVSPSVISERLKAARFDHLLQGEGAARTLLKSFDTEDEARE